MSNVKREFTQEESRQLYTMLHTLVFALRDIINRGLTADSLKEFTKELAIYFKSIERLVYSAESLLKSIDGNENPVVKEIETSLFKDEDNTDGEDTTDH